MKRHFLILKKNIKNIDLVNGYYVSRDWFNDKAAYEHKIIPSIKAGILSEDTVWNMNENIDSMLLEMEMLIKDFSNK